MNIELQLSDDAKDLLAEKGFDPVYGARPLKRGIERYLEDPLSEEILRGGLDVPHRIRAHMKDGAIAFDMEPIPQEPKPEETREGDETAAAKGTDSDDSEN